MGLFILPADVTIEELTRLAAIGIKHNINDGEVSEIVVEV